MDRGEALKLAVSDKKKLFSEKKTPKYRRKLNILKTSKTRINAVKIFFRSLFRSLPSRYLSPILNLLSIHVQCNVCVYQRKQKPMVTSIIQNSSKSGEVGTGPLPQKGVGDRDVRRRAQEHVANSADREASNMS